MFSGIYHVGCWTDDIAKAITLYETTFGGTVFQQTSNPEGNKMAFLHVGDTDVELIEPADKSVLGGQTGIILHHIGYLVPDIEQAITDLKAKGVKFATPAPTVTPTNARIIYLDTSSTGGARMHLTQI